MQQSAHISGLETLKRRIFEAALVILQEDDMLAECMEKLKWRICAFSLSFGRDAPQ